MSALTRLRDAVAAVPDPELPVLTIDELGILRDVRWADSTTAPDGAAVVTITPTYVGCPAMGAIGDDITDAATAAGFDDVTVEIVWSPAWTTDWLDDAARAKLAAARIAPPGKALSGKALPLLAAASCGTGDHPVDCPHCGSDDTALQSRFGSTACKSLRLCHGCRMPFDHFKDHR